MTLQRAHGTELLGEVAQYETTYRLCYLRGPAGIIVAPAEKIGPEPDATAYAEKPAPDQPGG